MCQRKRGKLYWYVYKRGKKKRNERLKVSLLSDFSLSMSQADYDVQVLFVQSDNEEIHGTKRRITLWY